MDTNEKFFELRQKAETVLKKKGVESPEKFYEDIEKLIEELNVHQIELEMQNQELQHTAQRLQAVQNKYFALYDNAPIAYFTLNKTGNIYELNNKAVELLGMPKQAFNKTSLFIYLTEGSKQEFSKFFKKVFLSGNVEHTEIEFINRHSEIIQTKLYAQSYFDYDKNKELCRCAVTNITEEIRLKKIVDNEQNKFKLLTDNSFDIISILDYDGTIKFESNAIKRILGYETGEREGMCAFDFVHQKDKEYVTKKFQELVAIPNSTTVVEFRFQHKNGKWKWLETSGQNFLDNPVINGIIVNSRDITERKEAEIQKNYLSAIIENTENICVVKDLNLRVIATNESFAKAAGKKSIKELIGKTDAEIFEISPEVEPIKGYMTDEKNVQKLKRGEKILREEIVIYPDKSVKTLLTSKFPVYDSNNQLIATANISTDITKLKEAEKKIIEKNEELNKLNDDKNRFMRILGHDLRSPFNSLLGFAFLLSKNIDKYDKTKIQQMVTTISEVAQNTYNLLNDLLLWSKSQSGSLPFEPKDEHVENIFEEIKNELFFQAQQKNIVIRFFETRITVLKVDANMFKTIFRNLISNAIKFSHKNSTVSVYCEDEAQQIIITFSDNGIGIKPEDLEKLWNKANPYSSKGTENEQGTGLGLLLVKEFVEKHNGKIWVESIYGIGSNFKIAIPINQ